MNRPVTALVLLSCIALGAVLIRGFAVQIYDPDVFMHLRSGQWITEQRSVPRTDPFSATAAGYKWIDHEWLWQLIAYHVYRTAGYWGLNFARIASIVGAVAFCLFSARLRKLTWSAILPAAALLICPLVPFAEIRPHTATFLFVGFLLWLLESARMSPRYAALLPPLFLIWANMHGAFIVGFVIIACIVAGWICEAVAGGGSPTTGKVSRRGNSRRSFPERIRNSPLFRPILYVSVFAAGGAVAALLNPYGFHSVTFSSRVLSHALFRSRIYEWAPPDWSRPFIPFYASAVLVAGAAIIGRKGLRPQDWLLMLLFGFLAFRMRRQIAFFCLVTIPTLGVVLDALLRAESHRARSIVYGMACALLLLWPAGTYSFFRKIHPPAGVGPAPGRFPITAASKLDRLPGGILFNDYNDGGYLIHRLWPKWQVTLDGRADVYGPEIAGKHAQAWAGASGWSSTLKDWNVSAILGRYEVSRALPQHNLYHELAKSEEWQLVYWDDVSLLYLRADTVAASELQPYDHIQPALLPRGRPGRLSDEEKKKLSADITRGLRENPSSRTAKMWEELLLRGPRM